MSTFPFAASVIISFVYLLIAVLFVIVFYTSRPGFHRVARGLIYLNLVLHVAFVVYSGILEGRVPLTSAFQVISFLTLIVALLYVFLENRMRAESLGTFVFPLIFVLQAVSLFGGGIVPMDMEILETPLVGFHIVTSVIGYCAFVYSMVLGVMYLYLFHSLKRKKLKKIYDQLPPLEILERMNGASQIGGLIFLTFGIVTGAANAQAEWNAIPISDPKIYLTFLLFVFYLGGVILKYVLGWGGKRMAYVAILGFCFLAAAFVVANFILPTIHRF